MKSWGLNKLVSDQSFSTLDHVFTLHAIIEYYKNKKGRVYSAFVDYSKAFDRIDRASLWVKLLKNGVNGKTIQVIYNMYKNAKSCVKICDKISDFFSCDMGFVKVSYFLIYPGSVKQIQKVSNQRENKRQPLRLWVSPDTNSNISSAPFNSLRPGDAYMRR